MSGAVVFWGFWVRCGKVKVVSKSLGSVWGFSSEIRIHTRKGEGTRATQSDRAAETPPLTLGGPVRSGAVFRRTRLNRWSNSHQAFVFAWSALQAGGLVCSLGWRLCPWRQDEVRSVLWGSQVQLCERSVSHGLRQVSVQERRTSWTMNVSLGQLHCMQSTYWRWSRTANAISRALVNYVTLERICEASFVELESTIQIH